MKSHTEAGKRYVSVSDYVAEVLEALREINGDKTYILNAGRDSVYPITSNHLNERLKKYCEEAGIKYHSSHKTRFGTITALYAAGVDEKVIQGIAGHSCLSTTRHYDRRPKDTGLDDETIQNVMGKRVKMA